MVTTVLSFKTRKQKAVAKKHGRIEGYFGKIDKGRPMKPKVHPILMAGSAPMNKTNQDVVQAGKKGVKGSYANWNLPENFYALKAQVISYIRSKGDKDNDENTGIVSASTTIIPRTTLQRISKRWLAASQQKNIPLEQVTREMIFPKCRGGGNGLLDDNQVELLGQTIIYRDEANNGMSRNEAISLVMELAQTTQRKSAEGHYDYLVRQKRLLGVKNFGRSVKAQATTSKRGQITVEQQLRWHTTVEEALDFQRKMNQPSDEYLMVEDHFLGNLDETCLMANADGSVRVIASLSKKKTEKNTDDSRASITSLRIGLASGTQGPFTFLAKGVRMDRKSIARALKERCPAGSQVIMSPSAYMTDETWLKLVPFFAKGIRNLDVIKDHADWWMTLTCDGFSSHTIDRANEIFSEHKIQMVKEEGDTSQVNQSYDQNVAKKDKSLMRMNLEAVRRPLGTKKIDQWTLIALAIEAQRMITVSDWRKAHMRVNTCPSTRLGFEGWIRELGRRGVLLSGEKFYTKRTSLFDAMPACWVKLSVEQRHEVLTIIQNVYDLAEMCDDKPEWTKEVVVGLARYVKLEEVYKLRACYLVSKQDPSVIVHDDGTVKSKPAAVAAVDSTLPVVAQKAQAEANGSTARDFFHWQPKNLMQEYMLDKKNPAAQSKLFHHMTNYAAQMMWDSKKKLQPSAYLDANMSEDQTELLQPSYKNTLQGFIMYDVKGKGAQNKLAKRRLDMISGNVSSYSRCLNDPKRLKQIKEMNQLAATVASVTAEMEEEKRAQAEKTAQNVKASILKKAKKKAEEEAERAVELPKLQPLMEDFETGRKEITVLNTTLFPKPYLLKILKYYYNVKVVGATKRNKQSIYEEVVKCFDEAKAVIPI